MYEDQRQAEFRGVGVSMNRNSGSFSDEGRLEVAMYLEASMTLFGQSRSRKERSVVRHVLYWASHDVLLLSVMYLRRYWWWTRVDEDGDEHV